MSTARWHADEPTDGVEEPRETASTTTSLIIGYVHRHGGDAAVDDLLRHAAVPFTADQLQDPARWFSYATRTRLFEAAAQVIDDPDIGFKIGAGALDNNLAPAIVLLLRALDSPAQVYRRLPTVIAKFSTTHTLEVVDSAATSATLRLRLADGYSYSRLDCQYAQGLIGTVPRIFSLPQARLDHRTCKADGADACVYRVTWQRRRRWWQTKSGHGDVELRALRTQLQELTEAATDLVGSHELTTAVARITERAASAVVAPAHLLAVHGTTGPPLVHSAGLSAETSSRTAERLLAGEDLGSNAVVVEVVTARRRYGYLAALYPEGHQGVDDEATLLAAYAAHAAAALELLALEGSRRGEARSRDLLTLAHRLADAEEAQQVADVVVTAVPTIVGAPRASFLAWDPSSGELRALSQYGFTAEGRAALHNSGLRPDDTPELARMLTRHEPTILRADEASPNLGGLLRALASTVVVAVPLLAGDTLLGVLTAGQGQDPPDGWPDTEAVERLRGVADQAASALQNARLIEKVRHQAQHDGLTGLPNRALFMQSLEQRLAGAPAAGQIAVLFCDLDDFKQINDQFGHATGDEVLRQVAARLRAVLRPGDLVARLSGDEFALVLRGHGMEAVAGEIADRVTDDFATSFRVDGRELRLSTSVGVAVQREDDDGDHLLRRADAAMYLAKRRGRNQVVLAESVPQAGHGTRSSAAEFRAGLRAGEFELHYQPVVHVRADEQGRTVARVVGQEALARWRHPQLGLLAPAAFLPLAEEAGDVACLDLWALRTAIAAAAGWDPDGDPQHVAVNLSAQTLVDPQLVTAVRCALAEADLDPALLTLEVVESRSLIDLPGVIEQLTELRRLGVRIALDDFGTGYSTLTWLQRLPIDQIKLDRSFVVSLADDDEAISLVEGVLALSRALGIEVVAEGVETERQLAALMTAGCTLMQGYRFGRPAALPAGDAPDLG